MKKTEVIYLKDYEKTGYRVDNVFLSFDLFDKKTRVLNKMEIIKEQDKPLFLQGEDLRLLELKMNGEKFPFEEKNGGIELKGLPEKFTLEIITEIDPIMNTSCEGLYKSGGIFCTQNEAQGFRKITYYFDRPDMMAVFTTKMTADKKKYPILLSNGNLIGQGDLENGRHWASWHDPFRKPCYLFALVAGDLAVSEDRFITKTGREVKLQIFVDKGNEDKTHHGMESLKKAMKWDEEVFGLEYDLDIYMIVAVDSFNMGAMENKGLNIFNSTYVLADKETAVDEEYLGIESVIAHEYFHNWTGNRVTCRDWFQLTLKEGLTVFRDQEFSGDMFDSTVQRIMDVTRLKEAQFPEDKGPMSHPIKPKSYMEVNNFYTATVYEKGAEVVRMVQTLIGKENFKKGLRKYFELYDGQAVCTENFIEAMERVSGKDLTQFKAWYDYAGTPSLKIKTSFEKGVFHIFISQETPKNGNEGIPRKPLHIPFVFGLNGERYIWELTEWEQNLEIPQENFPICEWNLDFSAPVYIYDDLGKENEKGVVEHGSYPFSRWAAYQSLLFRNMQDFAQGGAFDIQEMTSLLGIILQSDLTDAEKAYFLKLPSEIQLNNVLEKLAPQKVREWVDRFYKTVGKEMEGRLTQLYHDSWEDKFSLSSESMGKRLLRSLCLLYLPNEDMIFEHFEKAQNMNDEYKSLLAMVLRNHKMLDQALESFYQKWSHDNLVINKWFTLQALRKEKELPTHLMRITEDPVFSWEEPNKLRAVFGSFAMRNLSEFHSPDGSGYRLLAEVIEKLDSSNPQVGSRLSTSFRDTHKLEEDQRKISLCILEELLKKIKSPDCREVIGVTVQKLKGGKDVE